MKAWQVRELGEPSEVLELVEVAEPVCASDGIVVTVDAVGLNFPDLLMCQGKYQERPELPFTPGLEISGTIIEVGERSGSRIGDRVYGSPGLPRGGCAERAALSAWFPTPPGMSQDAASAWFVTYQTGYVALHDRAQLQAGETLLVHAGAGGVGTAAIQLGKAAGAFVIATAGGPEKVGVCLKMGADAAIDYNADDVVARVKELTSGKGADVIFDPVGGDIFDLSTKCVAFAGRILIIGFAGGRIASAATNHLLVKNYSIVGVHWGLYRSKAPAVIVDTSARLAELWLSGSIDPFVGETVPMDDFPAALERLGSRASIGKIVLHPNS